MKSSETKELGSIPEFDQLSYLLPLVVSPAFGFFHVGGVRGMGLLAREMSEKFHGDGENDGGILFGRDAVQRLKVTQLKSA